MAGSRRILASLPDFTLTDMDEALAAAAVAREESGSADEETALADARRGEPTYIQLQDPVVSDKEPVFLPLKPENIPHILQHLPDYAGYYLMLGEAYIIFHPFYSFIGLAIFFIVLTFFMIRLYRAHKRRRHRRNYRKMREKRLNAVKR
jgi:hypothetical protein